MKAVAQIDGAAWTRTGAIGIILTFPSGDQLHIRSIVKVYRNDNNQAEYAALIVLLERASLIGLTELDVESDSEVMVKQVTGKYRPHPTSHLFHTHRLCMLLKERFEKTGSFHIRHIPREKNRIAGALSQEALGNVRN